jgi:hypothetical protein
VADALQVSDRLGRRGRRIAVFLGVAALLGVYIWLFGFQNALAFEIRHFLGKDPVARMTPVTLRDQSVADKKGPELHYFGYAFEVPWDDLEAGEVKTGDVRAVLPFHSGLMISFLSMSGHQFVDALTENFKVNPAALAAMYGAQAMQDDYSFHKLMLYSTPDMVRPFGSRKDVASAMTLMIVKRMAVPADSGMFSITSGEFRGFQYGDPNKHPKQIVVDLYSAHRGVEFVFFRKNRQPLDISQAALNRVIQSLRCLAVLPQPAAAKFRASDLSAQFIAISALYLTLPSATRSYAFPISSNL